MQIGNFHFGKADSAEKLNLSLQEAALVWDVLVSRYKCIEETNIYPESVKPLLKPV